MYVAKFSFTFTEFLLFSHIYSHLTTNDITLVEKFVTKTLLFQKIPKDYGFSNNLLIWSLH